MAKYSDTDIDDARILQGEKVYFDDVFQYWQFMFKTKDGVEHQIKDESLGETATRSEQKQVLVDYASAFEKQPDKTEVKVTFKQGNL